MLSFFARLLLVATSLSPVLGAIAVNQYGRGEPPSMWGPWLVVALLLVCLCWGILVYAATSAQQHRLPVREFERNDQEVLAFLLAYMLPFVATDNLAFEGQWLTGAYILTVIFVVFAQAGALHFNPVMGLIGYHFYAVKDQEGVSNLLITRSGPRRVGKELKTVRLGHHIYLQIGDASV